MAVLATFIQQPAEVLDYWLDYDDWLVDDDRLLSAQATVVPSGLNVSPIITNDTRISLWVSGGVDKTKYKIELTVGTFKGRAKQDEFILIIKDT